MIDLGSAWDEGNPFAEGSNILTIELGDGGVEIIAGDSEDDSSDNYGSNDDFDANLALRIDETELRRIANELLDGIEADDESRSEWLAQREYGLTLLGLDPRRKDGLGAGSEGNASVDHPLLLEAVLRFQANARGEMLPVDGPTKIRDDGIQPSEDDLSNSLERITNHYLTVTATEFYPDTDRMLFWVGFGGTAFKKIYHCPLRNRPVSEMVDARNLIVSNDATDLQNAGRITHEIKMRRSVLRRMQLTEAYRDVPLGEALDDMLNPVAAKIDEIRGLNSASERPEDRERTIYECYCELDLAGYEHEQSGKPTGLALPYKVTIDKSSQKILEIRRNWVEPKDDDDDVLPVAKKVFVKYSFVPGLGFYDIGLLNILGNSTRAATASWRIMLDNGMRANFPGGFVDKSVTRQNSILNRGSPGEYIPIEVGTKRIQDAIMPFPSNGPTPTLMALVENIVQAAERVGGTAESNVGEGRADAPVGTTMALLEQQKVILDAVHKRMHTAQAEEISLLVEKIREDPACLFRGNAKFAKDWTEDLILQALDTYDLVPVSDPNTSSHLQRMAAWEKVSQMAQLVPGMFDIMEVLRWGLKLMRVPNPERLLSANPQVNPPKDPTKVASVQVQQQMAQVKQHEADTKRMQAAAKAQSEADRNKIEAVKAAQAGKPDAQPQSDGLAANVAMLDAQTRRMDAQTKAKALAVDMQKAQQQAATDAANRQSQAGVAALNTYKELAMHTSGLAENQADRDAQIEAARLSQGSSQ